MSLLSWLKPIGDRIPWVATRIRAIRDKRAVTGTPRTTPYGFRFFGLPSMMDGTFEPEETAVISGLLRDVDLFVNVGANVGYYVCHACHAGVPVVAVEPMAINREALLTNLDANRWRDRVSLRPLALSETPGTATIYGSRLGASLIPGWAGTPEHYSTVVEVSTLDAVLQAHLTTPAQRLLILVDIEGAELMMLRGALHTLGRTPAPSWIIEIAIHEHQPKGIDINPHLVETFSMFFERGYQAWTADAARRVVTAEEVAQVAATGVDTFGCHNFLFQKR
jgi:FkbM family methyltransferase